MKYATPTAILAKKKFFEVFPEATIKTGMWTDPDWTKEQFYSWFWKCLCHKTGGAPYTERQLAKIHDARIINDYFKGYNRRGMNILRDPAMKRKYPHINNNF